MPKDNLMTAMLGKARSKGGKMVVNKGAMNDPQTMKPKKLEKRKNSAGPSGKSDTATVKRQVMGIFS